VEGGSLGGARGPRPGGKAELAPRRSVSITWVNEGTRPNGDMSGASGGLPCGHAEPAPPRGGSVGERPFGVENPGIMWRGGSLGGARSPRPHGAAGRMARHCVATGAFPGGRWPRRGNVGVSVMPPFRACGARPSRGGRSKLGWPFGASPGIMWGVVLSEGRGLRARMARPN